MNSTVPILSAARRIRCLFVCGVLVLGNVDLGAQEANSTRKIRVQPTPTTKKVGTSIRWRPNFEQAVADAKRERKPVFWYVPTLPNTFMDRKLEINRYMLAGPFSWPAIANLINDQCIPYRGIPNAEQQAQFGLNPYQYVEPGFVLVEPDLSVRFALDRLTTMHPGWLLQLLAGQLAVQHDGLYHPQLQAAWDQFAAGNPAETTQTLEKIQSTASLERDAAVEAQLLLGMARFRMGQHNRAREIWAAAGSKFGDLPLGWKCSAESQNVGPFARGFEVHRTLPEGALQAGIQSAGSAAPDGVYTADESWQRSVTFLLGMQAEDGGFYDSDYDFGGTDSLPNVYVAVTSLAGMALLPAWERESDPEQQERLRDALDRSLRFAIDQQHINPADRDEILWAYAYRLRLVARCLQTEGLELSMPRADVQAALQRCIATLESVQSKRGSWYHEYANPFVTATALLALAEAEAAGGKLDATVIEKGATNLKGQRFANGAYPYGSTDPIAKAPGPGTPRQIAASAGRMPICELALLTWDRSDQAKLTAAIEQSFQWHKHLEAARKYDNHTSTLAYGGFFFWYDMRSRAEAIRAIEDPERRKTFLQQHGQLIMELPELDGCFIDSHELGRVYGTSMAILSMVDTVD